MARHSARPDPDPSTPGSAVTAFHPELARLTSFRFWPDCDEEAASKGGPVIYAVRQSGVDPLLSMELSAVQRQVAKHSGRSRRLLTGKSSAQKQSAGIRPGSGRPGSVIGHRPR